MVEYTAIFLYEWSKHGDDIKKVFHDNKLNWNQTKLNKLSNEDLLNEYKKFKVINDFKINKLMIGSSGIYENKDSTIMIKVIKIENNDNMLLVYKGIEEKFYIDFIKKCRDIGCLVLKIIDNEVIFKKRLNVKLINEINDEQGEKNVKVRNFVEKTKILEIFGEIYSDDFKNKWVEFING